MNRTKNSILNFAVTFFAGILLPLFGLIKYSLFIGNYGTEINGIQISMESVIAMLNIFEICFSLAFRQLLFKPLADDDKDKVISIYSKGLRIFRITGIVFLSAGLIIGLAFPFFNESPFNFIETVLYFVLLMIPYGISYFLMGPNLVLIADQKEYKINIWIQTISIIRMLLMIVVIILKLPVVLIFLIESVQILVANIISRKIALRLYPWLTKKEDKSDDKSLLSNIKYTLIQRMEVLSTTSMDTFVISIFMNYTSASIYGAYNYIVDNISKIINKALEATLNSFGNLFSKERNVYDVFLEFFEFVAFIASAIGICICLFFNDFIGVWLKETSTSFSAGTVLVIALSFNIFYMILREAFIISRDAKGLFVNASKNAIVYILTKVVLSIVLIYYFGISGAIYSTLIANLFIDFTYNPKLLCDTTFKNKTKDFYLRLIVHTLIAGGVGFVLFYVKKLLFVANANSIVSFLLSALVIGSICLIVLFILFYVLFKPFRLFVKRIIAQLKRRRVEEKK